MLQVCRKFGLGHSRKLPLETEIFIRNKKERLISIIHETQNNYDINRASWSLKTLADAYFRTYGEHISRSTVSDYFASEGYKFKRAKKVLTSSDPNYREQLQRIKTTLAELQANEKFFSIDEFGPFAIKIRGGTALVPAHEVRTIPQKQRSKGSLICTAGLELSTNQIIHFYSKKKNTQEIISLIRRVLCKYRTEHRIFVSWDADSWHTSKALHIAVDNMNTESFRERHRTPTVVLMPLRTGAQFLNVIESVFSGMARAISHNSDYQSVHECKVAIDRYFTERNKAFLEKPKKAGKKIWGKEPVEAVFREGNNCKDPRWR